MFQILKEVITTAHTTFDKNLNQVATMNNYD